MSSYIRPKQPGAAVFLTVNLADRGSDLLVRRIDDLRAAVRVTRAERPFAIEAWVVLPDHMHCVWRLPEGDSDFSTRMGAIKARSTRALTGIDEGGMNRRVGFYPAIDASLERPVSAHEVAGTMEPPQSGGVEPAKSGGVEPHPTILGRPRTKSKVAKGDGRVWQRRFWEHHIRDEVDFQAHVRYCWLNPVKHGLVSDPGEWPFSSYHRDGGGAGLA